MTSERKVHANQQNAKRSTGPRSAEGKARSRMNAIRHGLTAAQIILPGEDAAAFEALRAELFAEFEPTGARESFLVDRLAALIWRSLRVPGFEAGLLEWVLQCQAEAHDGTDGPARAGSGLEVRRGPSEDPAFSEVVPMGSLASSRLQTGRMLEVLLKEGDPLLKLARYDGYLAKQIRACVLELETFREARTLSEIVEAAGTPPPARPSSPANGVD